MLAYIHIYHTWILWGTETKKSKKTTHRATADVRSAMDVVALPLALPPALPATDALQCPHGAWNAPGAKGRI